MNKKPRICIVLDSWEKDSFLPQVQEDKLWKISDDLHFVEPSSLVGETAWIDWLKDKKPEILITGWMTPKLPENCMEILPELKYVCHLTGAVKGTVPQCLLDKGLLLTNWGSSVSRTIAETALMLAVGALRRVSHWTVEMHLKGGWKERTSVVTGSLFERSIGLHGFGAISRELVKLLQPFNVKISTYSPSVPDALLDEHGVRRAADLESLFSENEVIIELAALTLKNKGIVTEALLRSIPQGGVFVNVGRGAVVDEEALVRVAEEGNIQVALDVYGKEPLPLDSPFRGMTNVLLLPHLGGPTTDRRQDAAAHGIENIKRYLAGEDLESRITSEIYNRMT